MEGEKVDIHYHDWNSYSIFFSASSTQAYLKNCYYKNQVDQADQKSYQNCYPFIYYLEHGKIYYQQAYHAPLIIQPILLFYGFVHLIKACILTKDPNYPSSTSVLAHGVSTRKRKKQQYNFFDDEVKFQKSGLFPFMSDKLFNLKQLEGEKATMGELLATIPELSDLFFQLERKRTFMKVELIDDHYILSNKVLDTYHMTEARFKDFLQTKFQVPFSILSNDGTNLKIDVDRHQDKEPIPFRKNLFDGHYSFPYSKGEFFHFPELMIHYLLLYNLSMIARYETEWWSELKKMMPNNDFPFIQSFINTTLRKGPYLVYQFLNSQRVR
jgi:hypothetical protein